MKPPQSLALIKNSLPSLSKSPRLSSQFLRANNRFATQTRTMTGNTPFHSFYPGPSAKKLEDTASHLTNGHANGTVDHWATPGSAAFDFRSDTITTPTAAMLTAITATTLLDDVYQEDPTTNALQEWIANMTGKEEGLLVMSGTMGNQVAIRAHLAGPPHAVLCDHRGHILTAEAGGVASLCGAQVTGVVPANGHHLTLEDVKAHAILSDDIHACPTKLISLENTLGGTIMPLEEVRRISTWAHEHGIIMHLDGARLWEAVAAGAGSIKDFCDCFDTVQLCFSKGLGAPIGSIIVGSKTFVKRSRWIRKSIGGGIRMAGILSAAARTAVEETFLGGRLQETHQKAKRIAASWERLGGKLSAPTETNMVWLDLKAAGVDPAEYIKLAKANGIQTWGPRTVIHYQICEEALQKLEQTMEEALAKAKNGTK